MIFLNNNSEKNITWSWKSRYLHDYDMVHQDLQNYENVPSDDDIFRNILICSMNIWIFLLQIVLRVCSFCISSINLVSSCLLTYSLFDFIVQDFYLDGRLCFLVYFYTFPQMTPFILFLGLINKSRIIIETIVWYRILRSF